MGNKFITLILIYENFITIFIIVAKILDYLKQRWLYDRRCERVNV